MSPNPDATKKEHADTLQSYSASYCAGQGWRLAFYVVAGISGVICLLALTCITEPRTLRVGAAAAVAAPPDEEKDLLSLPARAPALANGCTCKGAVCACKALDEGGKENTCRSQGSEPAVGKAWEGEHALGFAGNKGPAGPGPGGHAALGVVGLGKLDRPTGRTLEDRGRANGASPGAGAPAWADVPLHQGDAAPAGAHPGSKDPVLRARTTAAFAYAGHALVDMAAVMWRMLRIPSFAIIMIEHVIGNLQSVSGYKIIYFQVRGSHPDCSNMAETWLRWRACEMACQGLSQA